MTNTRKKKAGLPEISPQMFLMYEELHLEVGPMTRANHLLLETMADAVSHGRMRDWSGEEISSTLNAIRLLVGIGLEAERLLQPIVRVGDIDM